MHDVAVVIPQYLDLDMFGILQVLFNENIAVAKGLFRLVLYQLKLGAKAIVIIAKAHATPAAACRCFEQNGIAELLSQTNAFFHRFHRLGAAGNGGNTGAFRDGLGGQFIAHLGQHMAGRADEDDALFLTGFGEFSIFA